MSDIRLKPGIVIEATSKCVQVVTPNFTAVMKCVTYRHTSTLLRAALARALLLDVLPTLFHTIDGALHLPPRMEARGKSGFVALAKGGPAGRRR
jgi:hypothetical protein